MVIDWKIPNSIDNVSSILRAESFGVLLTNDLSFKFRRLIRCQQGCLSAGLVPRMLPLMT